MENYGIATRPGFFWPGGRKPTTFTPRCGCRATAVFLTPIPSATASLIHWRKSSWDQKSDYSFKEALLPISETLFYFTDDNASVPEAPKKKRLIFLRSCEMNALRRLDQMYLNNGPEDFYYKRIRQDARFVLMGCDTPFASCFCASMGTNTCEGYHAYVHPDGDRFYLDIPDRELAACADGLAAEDASQR